MQPVFSECLHLSREGDTKLKMFGRGEKWENAFCSSRRIKPFGE